MEETLKDKINQELENNSGINTPEEQIIDDAQEDIDQSEEQIEKLPFEEIEQALEKENIEDKEIEDYKEKLKQGITNYQAKKFKSSTIKIDEKYISEQPPEIQKVLRPIKGDILTERALKNYINAQLFIEKQKSQRREEHTIDYKEPSFTETEIPEDAKEDFDKTVYLTLKVKYKDMPELKEDETPEENLKEYLSELQITDPLKYHKFLKDYDLASSKIKEEVSQVKYIEKNWEKISAENIRKDIQKFENELKEYNLSLKDLGLSLDLDDNYYNKYLYDNILTKDGKANPEVVQTISDKALLIPEGAVYKKLVELNFKNIIKHIQHNKNPFAGSTKIPPSMSSYSSGGAKPNKVSSGVDNILDLGVNEIDDETLEKYKEQIKSSIIGK